MLALDVALVTDRGGRKVNEDACGHWHSDRQLCCVLADGAGGHGGGDLASKLAVSELIGRFSTAPTRDADALGALVQQTNAALIDHKKAGTPSADMHSTAVCLVIDFVAHQAHWAHAGDSRLYWMRDGRVHRRTRDHSLVQMMVDAGTLAEEGMMDHPQRSHLRSALGVAPEHLLVSSAASDGPVQSGDVFMLCTDGLWEYMADTALEQTLQASHSARDWLEKLGTTVMAAPARKANHDNFTALVVWVAAA